jgi:hypothetical protein
MTKKSHFRKISRQQAAELLGVTGRHIQDLTARGVLPCVHEGRRVFYDPATLKEAFDNRPNSKPRSADLDEQRARLARVKADRLARLLEKECREVVPLEDLRRANDLATAVAFKLMRAFPDKAVRALRERKANHPAAIESSLRDSVYELLTDLARELTNLCDGNKGQQ